VKSIQRLPFLEIILKKLETSAGFGWLVIQPRGSFPSSPKPDSPKAQRRTNFLKAYHLLHSLK
jgi:hypothetical protein